MIIHIEGFNHKNEYFEQNISINNTPIYMLNEWSDYDWFQDGNELDCMFCEWSKDTIYTLYYNKNKYIRLRLVRYNKCVSGDLTKRAPEHLETVLPFLNSGSHKFQEMNIISPLVSSDIKVKDLKDILSIKDNIYFHNIKMNENKTLKNYNINNMDTLVCGSQVYAVVVAGAPADC